jgi:hypothetical protein
MGWVDTGCRDCALNNHIVDQIGRIERSAVYFWHVLLWLT